MKCYFVTSGTHDVNCGTRIKCRSSIVYFKKTIEIIFKRLRPIAHVCYEMILLWARRRVGDNYPISERSPSKIIVLFKLNKKLINDPVFSSKAYSLTMTSQDIKYCSVLFLIKMRTSAIKIFNYSHFLFPRDVSLKVSVMLPGNSEKQSMNDVRQREGC